MQLVPLDQPLSPHLHGVGFKEASTILNETSPSLVSGILQSLLAYVVVMLTSLVLPHFADPRSDVRLLASSVFTKLLILLPLEVSRLLACHQKIW